MRFFSCLKEQWAGDQVYKTREEAHRDLRECLMVYYYNTKRLHATLDDQTPFQFENNLKKRPIFADHYNTQACKSTKLSV